MLCSLLSSEMTFSAVGACAVTAVYEGSSGVNTADADCFLTRAVPLNKPSRGELGQNHCCGALMQSTQYTQQPIYTQRGKKRPSQGLLQWLSVNINIMFTSPLSDVHFIYTCTTFWQLAVILSSDDELSF